MVKSSLFDKAIFVAANVIVYAMHPTLPARYFKRRRMLPNVAAPGQLSELVQWRKVFERNPLYPVLLDKLAAKDWVRERAPDLAIPETLWVGDRASDIPDEFVAPGFVIKTNHGYNFNYFPHREALPREALNRRVDGWLQQTFGHGEQWGYRKIKPKVFVERLVASDGPLLDFTVRGVDGEALLVAIATAYKTDDEKIAYFTLDGMQLPPTGTMSIADLPPGFPVPPVFDEAVAHTRTLSRGIDYVRADFLYGGERLYFSELTLYPASGYGDNDKNAETVFNGWARNIGKSWFLSIEPSMADVDLRGGIPAAHGPSGGGRDGPVKFSTGCGEIFQLRTAGCASSMSLESQRCELQS